MDIKQHLKDNYIILKVYNYFIQFKKKKEFERIDSLDFSEKEQVISDEYKKRTGKELDWSNLRSYTEKMQWAKLYENDPIKTKLADKYRVREWVSERIGKEYLIPLLGVWDSFEEINFEKLPNVFVIKTNNAADTNLIVSENKDEINFKLAEVKFNSWLKRNMRMQTMVFKCNIRTLNLKLLRKNL